jgi:hypothetical protein
MTTQRETVSGLTPPSRIAPPVRRRSLALGLLAVSATMLGASSAIAFGRKLAPSAVQYRERPKGAARCDTCQFWRPPEGCEKVVGPISPSGWCVLYTPKR